MNTRSIRKAAALRYLGAAFVMFLLVTQGGVTAGAASSNEALDLEMITRIRDEGFHRSKVMETLSELTDRIGPRLTGSPEMKKANEWTRDQLAAWGLENAHLESWGPFGRGWTNELSYVRMVSPDTAQLIAYPEAWTPGTNGVVRGKAVKAKLATQADLDKYRGKLGGMVVLLDDPREVKPHAEPDMTRYTDQQLQEIHEYAAQERRQGPPYNREELIQRMRFRPVLMDFLKQEKPLAVINVSRGDDGTVFAGSSTALRRPWPVPDLVMATEQYDRIARLLDRDVPVELELNVVTKFYDDDNMAYNTVAEIPGTDKKDEIVMLGGHLDSWHTGTGATDNAAGSAVMMEAVRILKALGVKPRRTIRIALWSGEEEGLLGSRAYVTQHFGSREERPTPQEAELPSYMRQARGPLTVKPEQAKVSVYFNVDNGTGKIRGIYTQENAAVRPIFQTWFEPFHDLGASTISMRNTGGTDHLSFDAVGIPGFQFIQDPMDYDTRTHHSNMDVYERVQKDDVMQAAVIVASFVYNAAMRDDMMPRKPLTGEVKRLEEPAPPAAPAAKPGKKAKAVKK